MKKEGESRRGEVLECVCVWVGGGGGKPQQIPNHPLTTATFPSKRLHLSHRAVILRENRDQEKGCVDGWMKSKR